MQLFGASVHVDRVGMASYTAWTYQGTYLNVSRVHKFSTEAPSLGGSDGHVLWSAGNTHKSAEYVGAGGATPSSSGGEGETLDGAQSYLDKHKVHEKLQEAVNQVLGTMPDNALAALASAIAGGKAAAAAAGGKAASPGKGAAAHAAPAAPAGSEEEIKAQGDIVRAMKEANKATPGTHSKEELDAAVAKLKALKGAGGGAAAGGGDGKKDKKDKKDKKEAAPDSGKGVSRPQGGGKGKKDKDSKKGEEAAKPAGISTEPVTGSRDFYPDEMRVRNWLFGSFRDVAKSFAFQEYDAPVLEHEELYKRKAGEEIVDQMYNFEDKAGFKVTLRPEMTPTLARMILGRTNESGDTKMILPCKWFSIPQCWRFETTQRGRKREHYQWNMDIVGVSSITAEVELLAAITTFFTNLKITAKDVGIKVNSRKVMGGIMKAKGVTDEQFAAVCVIIDKLDKIGPDAVIEELTSKTSLDVATSKSILETMSAKSIADLEKQCSGLKLGEEAQASIDELKSLFTMAESYGYADYLIFDASVVRGLAYYTGVVFECFDRSGELRAICGGGRYDRLLTLYGSPTEIPCVGFGFGDCVIMELLEMKGLLPPLPRETDILVAAFNQSMLGPAMKVASLLRAAGAAVDTQQEPKKKVGQTFDYANRIGAGLVALVAPGEWEKGMVRIKNLRSENKDANQKDLLLADLSGWASLKWD